MENGPQLMERIQACLQDFGVTLTKSYYVSLVTLLVQKNATPQRASIERTVALFSKAISKNTLPQHLRELMNLRVENGQGGLEPIRPESVSAISQKTLEDLRERAREVILGYAALCNAPFPAARDAELAGKAFAMQTRPLLTLFNEAVLELLGAACSLAEQEKSLDEPRAQPGVEGFIVRDFVGRILFIPLENYLGIVDYDDKFDARNKQFPRCFCAPLLHVLRPLVIGREKYLLLNDALHTGISRILGEGVPITTENSVRFLHGEKIYKHIMSLSLHILSVYRDEELREVFLEKVNDDLRQRFPDIPLEFNNRFCAMLFKSWARFIYDQTPDFTNMKKTESILRHHIPEMFKPEEEAWVK